jgi:carbonic anhydrase
MKNLIAGNLKFKKRIVADAREKFEHLAKGQNPKTIVITCADSRVNPDFFLQTEPGELFVIRNAGNIVGNSDDHGSGELASIEFALNSFDIENIIICGHTDCGAVKGLISDTPVDLPHCSTWLKNGRKTNVLLQQGTTKTGDHPHLNAAIKANVLGQVDNLLTHAFVRDRWKAKKFAIHAWLYGVDSGAILTFDQEKNEFYPLEDVGSQPITKLPPEQEVER